MLSESQLFLLHADGADDKLGAKLIDGALDALGLEVELGIVEGEIDGVVEGDPEGRSRHDLDRCGRLEEALEEARGLFGSGRRRVRLAAAAAGDERKKGGDEKHDHPRARR